MCRHELDWQSYIEGTAANREEYETALSTCPQCLEDFAAHLQGNLVSPPPNFAARVMAAVMVSRGSAWKRYRPVVHYLVAASLTLVFLRLGLFDWLSSSPLTLETGFLSEMLAGLGSTIWNFITSLGGI